MDIVESRGYSYLTTHRFEIRTKECLFLYSHLNKVNVNYIKNIIKYVTELKFKHVILIYKDNITSIVKKIVELSDDIFFEIFNENDIFFNVNKHILVPKHEKN